MLSSCISPSKYKWIRFNICLHDLFIFKRSRNFHILFKTNHEQGQQYSGGFLGNDWGQYNKDIKIYLLNGLGLQ